MGVTATSNRRYRPFFWEEFAQAATARSQEQGRRQSVPVWAERGLCALREGLGCEPGGAPAMRHLHRVQLTDDHQSGQLLPDSYRAEHAALTLFGLHQSASADPVHRPGVGLGTAVRGLREGLLSSNAAERRLMAAATAQELDELVQHLRGLIPLLHRTDTGLDYTRLYYDLRDWLSADNGQVVRAWGLQYYAPSSADTPQDAYSGETAPAQPYWAGFDPQLAEAGVHLAALRSGAGRQAGTVPAMWSLYRTSIGASLRNKGALTRDLMAEHAALTIFGVHQQGRETSVHTPGHSPGSACRRLLASANAKGQERDSAADRLAVERRLGALLTSLDAGELAQHLRRLAPLLRKQDIGLDYDALRHALRYWDDPRRPDEQSRIRSRWDRDFHTDTTTPPA
ncbi:type I-E CRISPR-associated protein Cse2/CasB [Streptomyces sp. NPDC051677]|uniref:type I-E CRISPR-associated protein Cse2/CasB n=1 Tax=Streptomyces sp. NPDC051677 TaxID=3365669 RepID=UPI0037D404DB